MRVGTISEGSRVALPTLFATTNQNSKKKNTQLSSGEDSEGASFEGADEELIRRALAILEERGQVAIFKGDTSEEDGVKFF